MLVKFRDFHDFTWLYITSTQKPFSVHRSSSPCFAVLCLRDDWGAEKQTPEALRIVDGGWRRESKETRQKMGAQGSPILWWSNGWILFPTFSVKPQKLDRCCYSGPFHDAFNFPGSQCRPHLALSALCGPRFLRSEPSGAAMARGINLSCRRPEKPELMGVADDLQVMEDGYVMVRTRHQPFWHPWFFWGVEFGKTARSRNCHPLGLFDLRLTAERNPPNWSSKGWVL